MQKIFTLIKIMLRSKFIFKTPKKHDLILFDDVSFFDMKNVISGFNYFILQARTEQVTKVYISFKIFRNIFKNFSKGNLFTAYLVSLIELIEPKVVITNIDNSVKFSDVAKILEKKMIFIAVQNAKRYELLEFDYLYNTQKIKHNFLKKYYIPNLFSFGDHEKELYKKLNIIVKNIYPVGNLRWANFLKHIKYENDSHEKYNFDICLISEYIGTSYLHASSGLDEHAKKKVNNPKLPENINIERGRAKTVKYTIKFCIRNNMKLIIPLKRERKYSLKSHGVEYEFYKRNLEKEEFDYFQKNFLEKEMSNFSSYRAVLNSKVAVGMASTLLFDKLGIGGKILSCNLSKVDMHNFPISGICSLNNCTYLEFEKRLLEIYSISSEDFFSKIDKKPDYVMKFNKSNSTIDLIREKLFQAGVN